MKKTFLKHLEGEYPSDISVNLNLLAQIGTLGPNWNELGSKGFTSHEQEYLVIQCMRIVKNLKVQPFITPTDRDSIMFEYEFTVSHREDMCQEDKLEEFYRNYGKKQYVRKDITKQLSYFCNCAFEKSTLVPIHIKIEIFKEKIYVVLIHNENSVSDEERDAFVSSGTSENFYKMMVKNFRKNIALQSGLINDILELMGYYSRVKI